MTANNDEVDIVFSDPLNLSIDLFDQWLSGRPWTTWTSGAADTTELVSRYPKFVGNYAMDRTSESKVSSLHCLEKADANRLFNHLEHFFSVPSVMEPQLKIWFQIPRSMRLKLIEKYYGYDNAVMREIVSKRLTKSRRDAEEIAENTRFQKGSITRQVENVRRMYSIVFDETRQSQSMIKSIESTFLLPLGLCQRYATVLFLVYSKFDLTTKAKVKRLPCTALERCSSAIMAFLLPDVHVFNTVSSKYCSEESVYPLLPDFLTSIITSDGESSVESNSNLIYDLVNELCYVVDTIEPDKMLLASLRNIKASGESLDARVQAVKVKLKASSLGAQVLQKLSSGGKLKLLLTTMLDIGSHLSQAKEFHDLVEDIFVRIGDILDEAGLTGAEISCFFFASLALVDSSTSFNSSARADLVSTRTNSSDSYQQQGGACSPTLNLPTINNGKGSSRGDTPSAKIGAIENFRYWCRFVSCVRLSLEQTSNTSNY